MSAPDVVLPQMTLDGQLACRITLFLNLAVELGGVSDAVVPAPVYTGATEAFDVSPLTVHELVSLMRRKSVVLWFSVAGGVTLVR
ncbi:hypothetical protein [Streptomyces anthocyanicus]|uniref:hypothetical protein n=1 Tax=Streptomyces anthocyanicus TaxID=68174 RepID=UPI002F90C3C8|nr:hypothetical protein OH747_40150 [Streptomyces anthocyanicus]